MALVQQQSGPKPYLPPESSSPSQAAAQQYFNAYAQPQYAQIDLQQAQQRSQIGALGAKQSLAQSQYGTNVGFANRGYGIDMAKLGVQRQGNTIDANYIHQLLGLLGPDLQAKLAYQTQLEGFAGDQLGLQYNAIDQQYATGKRNQLEDATARGAFDSYGNGSRLQDLFGTKINQGATAKLGYDTTLAGTSEAKRQAQQDYEKSRLGYQHDLDLNANENKALDAMGADIGLSREKMLSSLQQGLEAMNLSTFFNVKDLMSALTSGDQQRMLLAMQVAQQAQQASQAGYFGSPTVYTSPYGNSTPTARRGGAQ